MESGVREHGWLRVRAATTVAALTRPCSLGRRLEDPDKHRESGAKTGNLLVSAPFGAPKDQAENSQPGDGAGAFGPSTRGELQCTWRAMPSATACQAAGSQPSAALTTEVS